MVFLYVLTLGVACVGYGFVRLVQQRRLYKDLPKPPHSFCWGHLKLFGQMLNALPPNCHPQLVLTMIAQRYNLPPIFYLDLWPFGPAQMVLSEPDAMSQVTTLRAYPKHDMSGQFVRPMVGDNNIVAANGPLWKFLHTLMAPAFTPGYVKSMIGVITDETTRFHATLASFADTGEAFSMEDTCAALIFDIIGRTTIGFSFKAQEGGSEILADLRDVVVYDSLRRLSWNPITKLSAYFKRRFAYQRSDRYIARWILHRYDALKGKGNLSARQAVTSILDRFLIEKLQQNEAIGREEQTMDPNFLQLTISNMRTILLGGHGTTTDTMCFIYLLLSVHPEAMKKLREEHDAVFDSDHEKTVAILHENPYKVNELEYTTAVIKETLRLFPVGFEIRQTNDQIGDFLEYHGQTYPVKNQMIVACQHTAHYNPKIYPSPSKFNPGRFINPTPEAISAWRPFSRGLRACLGQGLAIDEMRVILLLTARRYDFESVDLQPSVTQRVPFTDLDLKLGDLAFQELALEARPRGKVMMRVNRVGSK